MASNGRRQRTIKVGDMSRLRDETFFSIYCNNTNFAASQHDIQMLMSSIEIGESQKPIMRERGLVTMSPSHFKAFVRVLNAQLAEWEKKHGEIKLSE